MTLGRARKRPFNWFVFLITKEHLLFQTCIGHGWSNVKTHPAALASFRHKIKFWQSFDTDVTAAKKVGLLLLHYEEQIIAQVFILLLKYDHEASLYRTNTSHSKETVTSSISVVPVGYILTVFMPNASTPRIYYFMWVLLFYVNCSRSTYLLVFKTLVHHITPVIRQPSIL